MSFALTKNILRIPGRLFSGSTPLGMARNTEIRFGVQYRPIWAEEFGTMIDSVYSGETVIFAAIMRDFDADMKSKVFMSGAPSFNPISGTKPGTLVSTKSFELTFVPRAVGIHPTVTIHRALPMLDEAAAMQLNLNSEIDLAVAFLGIPGPTGAVYTIA